MRAGCPRRSGWCCSAPSRSRGSGLLLAGTLRAEANLAVANGLFLLLLFLGGMAYPLDRLPDALEAVARVLPAAALSECLRGVLEPGASLDAASSRCCRLGGRRAARRGTLVPLGRVDGRVSLRRR